MELGRVENVVGDRIGFARRTAGVRSRVVAVVDRDARTARAIETLLLHLGHRVEAFASAIDALPAVLSRRVGLLVTEHHLPPLDGATLCARARDALGDARPGFVLVTREPAALSDTERATYDAIVRKPVRARELLEAMRAAAARASRLSAHRATGGWTLH